ncbi:hypothetical protein C8T65DRAFT_741663 [Cerioporus squamosus]|nr:hypothetical protein C8T65DRAFT_741663 [Cerioporus squamosus]
MSEILAYVCILRQFIDRDTRLQYRLELGIAGVVEGPACAGMSVHQRLQKLREHSARLCASLQVLLPGPLLPAGTLSGQREPLKGGSACIGNSIAYVVKYPDAIGRLVVYPPPSPYSESSQAEVFGMPPFVEVAGVDASQRLVVSFTCGPAQTINNNRTTVYLSTIVEGPAGAQPQVHPQARYDHIELSFIKWPSPAFLGFKVYNRYMAWCTKFVLDPLSSAQKQHPERIDYSLEVWDWQEGCLRGYFGGQCTFTFLDHAHILVSVRSPLPPRQLLVYQFVYTQDSADHAAARLNPKGCDSCALTPTLPPPTALFAPDPALRPVVAELRDRAKQYSTLVLPASSILYWVKERGPWPWVRTPSPVSPPEIPWEELSQYAIRLPTGLDGPGIEKDDAASTGPLGNAPHGIFSYGSKVAYVGHHPDRDELCLMVVDLNHLAALHEPHKGLCVSKGPPPRPRRGQRDSEARWVPRPPAWRRGRCTLRTSSSLR